MPQKRILIVDDEKNIVSSLKEILMDEGYDVSVAGDGLNALEMVQSDPPDLLDPDPERFILFGLLSVLSHLFECFSETFYLRISPRPFEEKVSYH